MILEHIGIAVHSIEESIKFWKNILGFHVSQALEVPSQKVRVAAFDAGGVKIELIEPTTDKAEHADDNNPITKFLEKNGAGIHHLCFEVKDISSAITELKKQGISIVDKQIRTGAFAKKVAFLHPKSTHGILIELCEK